MDSSIGDLDIESAEDVLNIVCQDNSSDLWKDSPEAVKYLEHLSSFGIQRLAEEPERLAEEKSYILEQTQELAFHNYKTFIQTADCSREIYEEFSLVEERLDALLSKVPKLNEQCALFSEQTQKINRRWRQSSVMLSKHPQLLEILEIPQIMDTCVRNSYFEEALDLSAYIQRLERKHSSIPLIKNIALQVESSQQLMLSQLLQSLRSGIKLPDCLRLVNHLRRMNVFSEGQLRMKFLQARDDWFKGLLAAIPNEDHYLHISKVIELSRVHLFDIITQYRAVFSDDDPLTLLYKDKMHSESNIFHSWLVLKISQFLDQLVLDLSRDMSNRLDSVLSQSMYFGLSFSRVGVDFRPLLAPIFHQAILNRFQSAVSEVTQQFENLMESFTLLRLPSPIPNSLLSVSFTEDPYLQPPLGLLEFPPLASYCNGVLGAFNDLRLCAPTTLAYDICMTLQKSLTSIVATVLRFYKAEEKSLTAIEQSAFERFCVQLSRHLLPHLNSCLGILFVPTHIAKVLGISANEFLKISGVGQIDVKQILEPMSHLIPQEELEDDEDNGITITVQPPVEEISNDEMVPTVLQDVNESSVDVNEGSSDVNEGLNDVNEGLSDVNEGLSYVNMSLSDANDVKSDEICITPAIDG